MAVLPRFLLLRDMERDFSDAVSISGTHEGCTRKRKPIACGRRRRLKPTLDVRTSRRVAPDVDLPSLNCCIAAGQRYCHVATAQYVAGTIKRRGAGADHILRCNSRVWTNEQAVDNRASKSASDITSHDSTNRMARPIEHNGNTISCWMSR